MSRRVVLKSEQVLMQVLDGTFSTASLDAFPSSLELSIASISPLPIDSEGQQIHLAGLGKGLIDLMQVVVDRSSPDRMYHRPELRG